jgi:hypothetical protein
MATRCCSLSTWQVGLVIPKRRSRKRWTSPRLTVGRSNHRDQDILGARRYASAQNTTASCGSGRHRECRPTMPSRFAGPCTTANESFFCQGEGRGFESRRPLQKKVQVGSDIDDGVAPRTCPSVLATCPSRAPKPALKVVFGQPMAMGVTGSIRQRGVNSWELRVYRGTDPTTGRRRWATRTVRGSRTEAQQELVDLARVANVAPVVGARTTMTELLERWYGVSYVNWAPTTARSVRSIIDQQLVPGIGEVLVRELTAVTIDELYSRLRVSGRADGKALSVGSVRRAHAVSHRALAQAMRWEWIWANPAALASPPRSEPVEMRPPTPADVAVLLVHGRNRSASASVRGSGGHDRSPKGSAPGIAVDGHRLRHEKHLVPACPGRRAERAGARSDQDPAVASGGARPWNRSPACGLVRRGRFTLRPKFVTGSSSATTRLERGPGSRTM